ncbi:hypothetical protein M0R45_028232 [Rubus argutus]|uniref:Uncharacterized protein n=1 Tax=Rubus argutus TaxID=59490 RepID=A0AAW1W739_RUBAR
MAFSQANHAADDIKAQSSVEADSVVDPTAERNLSTSAGRGGQVRRQEELVNSQVAFGSNDVVETAVGSREAYW